MAQRIEEELNRILQLDHELLSLILSCVPTRDILPCFLTCKAFFKATKDELAWQRRCDADFGISAPDVADGVALSWYQTYQGTNLMSSLSSPPHHTNTDLE